MADAQRAKIVGIGAALPQKVLTNADFEKFIETSDEWITQRTGIKERRVASEGETTATLAVEASRVALKNAGFEPTDLDLIICCTVTPEMPFPATACFVQAQLGATGVPAFDIIAACSGFLYGLTTACKYIETGMYRRILVIGADTLSRVTDYTDRGSCILFGDGAGAVVLEATTEPNKGVIYNVMHADGTGWDFIHVPGGGSRTPATHKSVDDGMHFVKMRGRDVYKFAVEKMQWLLGDCMSKCGLSTDDVAMVIPHQVNVRIIASATEKYNFPLEKVYMNIERFGNTSAASIPVALDEAWRLGRIKTGDTIMLVAFGAGLTWAGSVIKL
ncbi:MAG: ketoacyl-ACP synthase III [Planctomycetes bacterium]|nr:ketoacyl-ACP synthase III [Planctomycetota bacterium]